jgi:hypothetical protein
MNEIDVNKILWIKHTTNKSLKASGLKEAMN